MNRIAIVAALVAGIAVPSFADYHGLSLPDYSTGIHIWPKGGRGFVNGQWLTGTGADLAYYQIPGTLAGKPLPKLTLSFDHYRNAAELLHGGGQGIMGPSVGADIGGLASKLQYAVNAGIGLVHQVDGPVIQTPPWIVNDLDKWVSLEVGGGYRLFGHMDDVKPWEAWVSGKVSITFDVSAHH